MPPPALTNRGLRTVIGAGLLLFALLGASLWAPPAQAAKSLALRASLQAAMQRHIDRALVDGAYLHLDSGTGKIRRLHPVAAHPLILRLEHYFVLCADFLDVRGNSVNIDFYLAPRGSDYVVFADQVDNRALIGKLGRAGKLERLD